MFQVMFIQCEGLPDTHPYPWATHDTHEAAERELAQCRVLFPTSTFWIDGI